MVNFNMKDTIGRGIRKVFTEQKKRKIGNFLSTLKKKGIINALPDLQNLNDGDLIYTEDFRKIYATVLKNWLGADENKILGWKNGVYDFV